jgi:ribonuclease P/MRP protein subunit RPP40
MLHGKKGFGRIVYAFENVLISPVTWLFCDLAATGMFF